MRKYGVALCRDPRLKTALLTAEAQKPLMVVETSPERCSANQRGARASRHPGTGFEVKCRLAIDKVNDLVWGDRAHNPEFERPLFHELST
jgi:hypothetical protein